MRDVCNSLEEVVQELGKIGAKRIIVQFPEGLKYRIQDIVKSLEKHGIEVSLCLESTWGSCDVRENEAKLLNCQAIVHIAHVDFRTPVNMPVVYWDYFTQVDPVPILEKEFQKLDGYKNIGLVASLQFIPAMAEVRNYLESHGKTTFSEKTEEYVGQILGCRVGAGKLVEDRVDCFLCVSAGKFYPLGLALKTNKTVLNLDLEQGRIFSMDQIRDKTLKIIAWNKGVFKDAKRVGLLVSFKLGQYRNPFQIKKTLEKQGKEVYILAMDEFSPDKLEGMKLDFLINLSCPRVGIDDQAKYKMPMLNYYHIADLV